MLTEILQVKSMTEIKINGLEVLIKKIQKDFPKQ